ncbi:hypothetical protein HanXRQr2_Chr15g0672831 [Helianthus annuus]|uniref:Uncharacterized protein n=1 Tax=Helianthus annuus TaxID=4232 RepID=A0A9K3DWC8_HELAN|nr:hypothetical protein HanXRQr2_Chr15g0672831 [Helianthus annuus]
MINPLPIHLLRSFISGNIDPPYVTSVGAHYVDAKRINIRRIMPVRRKRN